MTSRTRRAPAKLQALYLEDTLRRVLAGGLWPALLPVPLDGLLLVPSRSVEDGSHEVQLTGRRVLRCSGPCGAHPTCWHRASAALASWQSEHLDWDVEAIRDERTGEYRLSLIRALINEYLTMPAQLTLLLGPAARDWRLDPVATNRDEGGST